MKHIEVSKKIELAKPSTPEDLKKILMNHLEKTIDVETVTDGDSHFKFKGTTGAPASMTRHSRVEFDVSINYQKEDGLARIIISGHARAARSLVLLYSMAFFLLLLVGLLPGFYETSQEESGAIDALFFLIFGIFIVYDVNSKLALTKEHLETALQSFNTALG